ncbi:MAG: type II toxin-antitoxin system RelE/ParE family toxin [Lachnospiraceae bacterium]|nr:type II toxin-antitoxin system RelE/ParE family toxin [Lachnospiraceae bacterium]
MAFEIYDFEMTDAAYEDLDQIINYISYVLLNPYAAGSFLDLLEKKIGDICKLPKSGEKISNIFIDNKSVRKILVNNYIIYYLEDSHYKKIIILRIVYSKRNQDEIIEEL